MEDKKMLNDEELDMVTGGVSDYDEKSSAQETKTDVTGGKKNPTSSDTTPTSLFPKKG